MISFITTGRNDDYGKGFIDRFYTSVSKNLESLEKLDVEYEYILVEWNPFNKYLIYTNKFSELFKSNKRLIDLIAAPSLNLNEGLGLNAFHEYYGKNLGIRHSKFENIVLLNADVVIPFDTMEVLVNKAKTGLDKKKYYRVVNRVQADDNLKELRAGHVNIPALPEHAHYMEITGDFPGDLCLIDKSTLINKGKGYDEANNFHRTGSQVHMDSEIMYNLYRAGCKLEYLDCDYLHIEHSSPRNPMEIRVKNVNGYQNKTDWGFINYPAREIKNNLIIVG